MVYLAVKAFKDRRNPIPYVHKQLSKNGKNTRFCGIFGKFEREMLHLIETEGAIYDHSKHGIAALV